MKKHSEKLKIAEKELRKRIGILKQSILNTKSKFIIFKSIIKSKYWYIAGIRYYIPSYIWKLEAMLNCLLKQLFCIKSNVNKQLLLNILKIEEIRVFINRAINKLNCIPHFEPKKNLIVELLSIQAIKLKLNWLFFNRNRTKLWSWATAINNNHFIREC